MSFVKSSYDYNYEEGDQENLPSFEVIQGPTGRQRGTVVYNRANDATVAASPAPVTENQDDLTAECRKYLQMILKDVGKDDGERKPMIIVVIGPPGVGKSSFVCSLAAAFSQERWREYAYVGSYGEDGEPITVFVETFEKCAMNRIEENAQKYEENLLPTLVDVAGVENENSELWKELLKIVFFGRLPEGEALYAAYQYGVKVGVQGLRDKYAEYDEDLKVDRIIFLASATEEVPINLIQCVREAARPGGDDDNKRAIPLFGVMTKLDRVSTGDKEGEVSRKTFEEREKRFIRSLGLLGATNRYVSLYNYCDDTDEDKNRLTSIMPQIDAPLLKFMTQVCDPAIRVINPDHTFTSKAEDVSPKREGELRKRKAKETEQNTQNEQTEQKVQGGKTNIDLIKMVAVAFILIVLIYIILFVFLV